MSMCMAKIYHTVRHKQTIKHIIHGYIRPATNRAIPLPHHAFSGKPVQLPLELRFNAVERHRTRRSASPLPQRAAFRATSRKETAPAALPEVQPRDWAVDRGQA